MNRRCFNCMKEYDEQYEVCPFCGYVYDAGPAELFQLAPGEILNRRYIVGTAVDNGGFGIIYRAWDAQMEQMVAIKEYYPGGMVNRTPGYKDVTVYSGKNKGTFQKGKERFLTEARYAASLSDPGIVAIYDFFEENNTAYIVMEYLDGVSLKTYIKEKGGRLSCEEMTDIALRVLGALEVIHGQGIIHRDISPDNIFVCSSHRIKVIDFGAARFSGGNGLNEYSSVVKPGYAPTEQYQTKSSQGPFTDLYALGACMYHALTGVKPQESLARYMNDEMEEPRALNPDIPDYMNDIIMKAMAMDGASRFQTTEEFAQALKSHIAPPVPAPAPSGTDKKPKKEKKKKGGILKVIAAVLVLLLACGGGYFGITRHTRLIRTGSSEEITFYVKESQSGYYEKIAGDYEEEHAKSKITVKAVVDESYKDEVEKKLNGKSAVIFFSDDFKESELSAADNMDKYVADKMGKDNFYYYSDYYKKHPDGKKMPLSFSVPFILENTKKGEKIKKLETTEDLKKKKDAKKDVKKYQTKKSTAAQAKNLAAAGEKALSNQVNGSEGVAAKKGIEKFQKGKAAYYITDWADYKAMIDDADHYMDLDILYPESTMNASLSEYVSILDKGNKQTVMEAENFVIYMAQNQEKYFLEDRDKVLLPVSKKAVDKFGAIWSLNLKYSGSEEDGDKQFKDYLEKCGIQED